VRRSETKEGRSVSCIAGWRPPRLMPPPAAVAGPLPWRRCSQWSEWLHCCWCCHLPWRPSRQPPCSPPTARGAMSSTRKCPAPSTSQPSEYTLDFSATRCVLLRQGSLSIDQSFISVPLDHLISNVGGMAMRFLYDH